MHRPVDLFHFLPEENHLVGIAHHDGFGLIQLECAQHEVLQSLAALPSRSRSGLDFSPQVP